jgi:hypothetical protein
MTCDNAHATLWASEPAIRQIQQEFAREWIDQRLYQEPPCVQQTGGDEIHTPFFVGRIALDRQTRARLVIFLRTLMLALPAGPQYRVDRSVWHSPPSLRS